MTTGPQATSTAKEAVPAAARDQRGAEGTNAPGANPAGVALADGGERRRMMIALQGGAGNRAVQRLVAPVGLQRKPPPTRAQTEEVVDLMPIMGDLDALMTAVGTECAAWRSWRGTLTGTMPGAGAFAAMDQFKNAIRAKGFDTSDERVQRAAQSRVKGDTRQLLMEMCSFALGAKTRSGGDYTGLARLCGVQTKALTHTYRLKIGYSVQVKGKLGIGVGYTFRSAAMAYSNAFGMTYNKPLSMSSLGAALGPSAGLKGPKGQDVDLPGTGAYGFEGDASTESLIFWHPDDFETTFSATKVAAGAAIGEKIEAKVLEIIRVTSSKHPPLLFDLLSGQTVTLERGVEVAAEVGAGVEWEYGKARGGPEVGATDVHAPALDEARKNAEKAGLTTPDPASPDWEVVGATVVSFDTGKALPTMSSQLLLSKFVAYVAAWSKEHEATNIRFEVVGQASPRWRHPKMGQVPLDLNQKLSEERAEVTKILIEGDWADVGETSCSLLASGCAGPEREMDDERAYTKGTGAMQGLAETNDPDNDDAAYRVASITAWGKRAPAPTPEGG